MARANNPISRRAFLMPDGRRHYYISSAVVVVMPGRSAEVIEAIARMGGAEVRACENHRIVVVIEGSSGDDVGGQLIAIGNLDGVIAANLVFEHVEDLRSTDG